MDKNWPPISEEEKQRGLQQLNDETLRAVNHYFGIDRASVFANREWIAIARLLREEWEKEKPSDVERDARRHRFARTIFSIEDVTLAFDSMRGFSSIEEENTKYDAAIDAAIAQEEER